MQLLTFERYQIVNLLKAVGFRNLENLHNERLCRKLLWLDDLEVPDDLTPDLKKTLNQIRNGLKVNTKFRVTGGVFIDGELDHQVAVSGDEGQSCSSTNT